MDKIIKLLKDNVNDIIKPVCVLLAICIIIPLALAGTNLITTKKIAELEIKKQKEAMESLIVADSFSEEDIEGSAYYKAIKDDAAIGYIFITSAAGYGGDVSVMTACELDGTIKAVKILDVSNETPGLGQNTAKESFYSQFSGKSGKIGDTDIKAVTAATISSNAVRNAVNKATDLYSKLPTEEEVAESEE